MSSKKAARTFTRNLMVGTALAAVTIILANPAQAAAVTQEAGSTTRFNIPAQDLDSALTQFARQSGQQLLYAPALVSGKRSNALVGAFTPREGLVQLLSGSGIGFRIAPSGAFLLGSPGTGEAQAGGAAANSESADAADAGVTPEILVVGTRSQNADIRRTENDAQPYVTFDRNQIRNANATNVEDFLKTRLPMNTVQTTPSQQAGSQNNSAVFGNTSSVNLRGLGGNQTLILVDGRRLPNINTGGSFNQPDINGIPLSSIERIEVLPSTASGIYGGGATGGVVNIITRGDYSGLEAAITYDDNFVTSAPAIRLDVAGGFSFGHTNFRFSASHSESDPLLVRDRDFAVRARSLAIANNPNVPFAGGPPIPGYTSNICAAASATSQSCGTAQLVLDNGTPLGSSITFVPIGYQGPATDGGAALVANAGRFNIDLPDDLFGARQSILNNPTTNSASFNARHAFSRRSSIFVDLSWFSNKGRTFGATVPNLVNLPANAPNNPFTVPIAVRFPATDLSFPFDSKSETIRALGGVIVGLPGDWTASAEFGWSRSRFSYSFTNPVAGDPDGAGPGISVDTALRTGTPNVMRDLNAFPLDYGPYLLPSPNRVFGPSDTILQNGTFRVAGPVVTLPGGPLGVTGLAEIRKETALDSFVDRISPTGVTSATFTPERSQSVRSLYLETRIPIFSERNATAMFDSLELSGSIRYDEYETRSPNPTTATVTSRDGPLPTLNYRENNVHATSYSLGLLYRPVRGIALRASFGTGFLPPSIDQIVPADPLLAPTTFRDPKRGGISQQVSINRITGGNPDLVPETSRSWSAGAVLTPGFIPNLRLSIDYTRIRKRREIAALSVQQIIDLEDFFPGRVTRAALTPADSAAGFTGGLISGVDASSVNIAAADVEAWDFQLDYSLPLGRLGQIDLYAIATHQTRLARQTVTGTPFVDTAGFDGGPLRWRANFGATWDLRPWTIGWNAQYFDSYFVYTATSAASVIASSTLLQGSDRIGSQIYHNAFVRVRLGDYRLFSGLPLSNAELSFAVNNLFNSSPPIKADFQSSTGGYSTYGDPRLRRYSISLRTTF